MTTNRLQDRVAVITGASTGIGFATAQRFVAEGAKVVITGRNAERLEAARQKLGEQVLAVQGDASDLADVDRLIATVGAKFGRIDVLYLNAGIATFAPVDAQSVDAYRQLFDVNVFGPYFTVQKALPLLNEGASVLFTTSVVNEKGMLGASAYAATKAALRSIVRVLANELAGRGIRVNAVSPGPIETPIFSKTGMTEAELDGFAQQIVAGVPLGRFGQASEVANAALFLASTESAFVTGTELSVDGGFAQV